MSSLKTPLEKFTQWESSKPNTVWMHQPVNRQYHTFTWKQAGEQVRKMAAHLKAQGYPPGSHIAVMSKNCAHWIMADLAIWMAGHVSVPLYPNLTAETINQILTHSESKLLFVGKLDGFAGMKSGIPSNLEVIAFPNNLYNTDKDYKNWDDVIGNISPISGDGGRKHDEMATIIYTSGTTGMPKGVMHRFEALSFAGTNAVADIGMDESERYFSYLPLSHVAERLLVETGCLYSGGTIYFAESLDTFKEDLQTARPTAFLAVPRIWTKFQDGILKLLPQAKLDKLLRIPILSWIIKNKIKKGLGLDQARHLITGAAPMPYSLMQWYKKLGMTIIEGYGMTENLAYSHYMRAHNWQPGTVGQPWPHVDVRISDEGEIQVKSRATMIGYFKEPEKTKEVMEGDYLKTGDQGAIAADGTLKITGRVKDLFKTSKGKFVAPSPIELKLAVSVHIECVCVVGNGMSAPLALITRSEVGKDSANDHLTQHLNELLTTTNQGLDAHERLSHIVVVEEDWTVENGILTPTMKINATIQQDNVPGVTASIRPVPPLVVDGC